MLDQRQEYPHPISDCRAPHDQLGSPSHPTKSPVQDLETSRAKVQTHLSSLSCRCDANISGHRQSPCSPAGQRGQGQGDTSCQRLAPCACRRRPPSGDPMESSLGRAAGQMPVTLPEHSLGRHLIHRGSNCPQVLLIRCPAPPFPNPACERPAQPGSHAGERYAVRSAVARTQQRHCTRHLEFLIPTITGCTDLPSPWGTGSRARSRECQRPSARQCQS